MIEPPEPEGREQAVLAASARAEERRQSATRLVHAVYRVVKACMLHDDANQAVGAAAAAAADAVADFCRASEVERATILFASDAVFVNHRMLRASREAYALATELGRCLEVCDATELTLARDVRADELVQLGRAIADAHRDRRTAKRLRSEPIRGVRVRRVTGFATDAPTSAEGAEARVVRTYAAVTVILRRFYEALGRGERAAPLRVKRVAQRLVAAAEDSPRALIALAASSYGDPDPASAALGAAVLAIAMARQLTSDRLTLANLAIAALLYDVGRVRLLAGAGELGTGCAVLRALEGEELDRLPASQVVAMTALGRIAPGATARAAIAYEAIRLRHEARVGPAYRGRRPISVLARILAVARAFTDLRVATTPGAPPVSVDDAIQHLMSRAEDATERTYVKLLTGALGIFPAGTLVELNTGELAVVMATPALPADFARPPVRILYDANARLLEAPFDVDLAAPPSPGEPARFIRRPIDADEQQMKAMRAFVVSAAGAMRRGGTSGNDPRSPRPIEIVPAAAAGDEAGELRSTRPDPKAPALPGTGTPRPAAKAPKPARSSPHADGLDETSSPPSSNGSQDVTARVNWREYGRLVFSQRRDQTRRAEPDPPPEEPAAETTRSPKLLVDGAARSRPDGDARRITKPRPADPVQRERDALLAAYLADEPIDEVSGGATGARKSSPSSTRDGSQALGRVPLRPVPAGGPNSSRGAADPPSSSSGAGRGLPSGGNAPRPASSSPLSANRPNRSPPGPSGGGPTSVPGARRAPAPFDPARAATIPMVPKSPKPPQPPRPTSAPPRPAASPRPPAAPPTAPPSTRGRERWSNTEAALAELEGEVARRRDEGSE